MAPSWLERFLRMLALELNGPSPVIAEMQPCGANAVAVLQDAALSATAMEVPNALACGQLDHLINDSHRMMASSSPTTAVAWRRLYCEACIIRAMIDLREFQLNEQPSFAISCISRLDHAIVITGAPGEGRRDFIIDLIGTIQSECLGHSAGKRSLDSWTKSPRISHYLEPPAPLTSSKRIRRLQGPPPLASFMSHYSRQPFVIHGYIKDWPAMNEHPWSSPAYLRAIAGPGRVVPVEVGSDYREDDWSQEMMSWDKFLDTLDLIAGPEGQSRRRTLYLAQHNLLSQFPDLRADIEIPDYAYTSLSPPEDFPQYVPPGNEEQLVLNAWFGPAGTISPAHTDPYFNLYAQVVGRKTVWLAPPNVSTAMYPYPPPAPSADIPGQPHNPATNHTNPSMNNTSQVDVFKDQPEGRETWPLFWTDVVPRAMTVTLEPGDLLFFPPGWWHAMRSEETSFSVSMWF